MGRRKSRLGGRHGRKGGEAQIELNVMPFVDVFSLLCTFLLFSAAFVTIGIHEVQIPFFTNAAPEKKESERSLSVKVDVERNRVEVTTSFSKPPVDEQRFSFDRTPEGLINLHQRLVRIRSEHPDTDLVTLFMDEDLTYSDLVAVLDEIKLRKDGDPPPTSVSKDISEGEAAMASSTLFPKVVMGDVVL